MWRPRNLPEPYRLRERGPQLACPRHDHGGPSKAHKIPSVHVILIPVVNASADATAPYDRCRYENRPGHFAILPLRLLVEWLGKNKQF
jgi:hypothetical protein